MAGFVYLVGAGPGDVDLITLKAIEAIKKADVIVYDRLINDSILAMAKDGAEFIDVGKMPDSHKVPQWRINEIIAEKALEGNVVVRLKGGDPYVFGRGGEEGEYLYGKGIPFEVIPGITSAVAVLTYAGIPITHRNLSSSFHVITGHEADDKLENLDWKVLSKLNGTLVFLMGMKNIKFIANKLIENGMSKDMPAAVIMNGTTPKQKSVNGTLSEIAYKSFKEGIHNPAIIVVGKVVNMSEKLNWFEKKRLFGKRILLTSDSNLNSDAIDELCDNGADVVICPTIKIIYQIDNVIKLIDNVNDYEYLIFASKNGVKAFENAINMMKFDVRRLYRLKIAAIGDKTNEALNEMHIYPDIVPEEYTSKALADKLKNIPIKGKVALLTSDIGGDVLIDNLKDIAFLDKIVAYKNTPNYEIKDKLINEIKKGIDMAIFTSTSTFNYMSLILGDDMSYLRDAKIAAIGPVTKESIERNGFKVDIIPNTYTFENLIKEILKREA
ncbi:uroporphyrinogen-III C-methyltransferase [Thermoanaerobacterium sp. PSU-2]|uniref:uroporphyrinogen-III C-methyltransferase n=1 Tax=Thermoanaerobacterium sp. PSU-2 TaxID=1930849 RepID=UPI000A16091B|nr:uroporphyrinogen-III C-methyltransferase [Thermoanaerobacterium sp. PSU-2]ORX23950.1 uroporphyrinogen-III C-methyltransferase [Thermoanaerobacterium sp. PSU-2]